MHLDSSQYPPAARETPWFRNLIAGTNAAADVPLEVRAALATASVDRAVEQATAERHRVEELAAVEAQIPRTDGVYLSEDPSLRTARNSYFYYLRFYADGRVVSVTVGATPAQVAGWLEWNADAVSRGRFTLRAREIDFEATSQFGTVEYHGIFESRDQITMESHSRINDYRGRRVYTFAPVPFSA